MIRWLQQCEPFSCCRSQPTDSDALFAKCAFNDSVLSIAMILDNKTRQNKDASVSYQQNGMAQMQRPTSAALAKPSLPATSRSA
eukprot:4721939-Amphidinium_carterae.1